MENDSLKSAWKQIPAEEKSSGELQAIVRKRSRSLTNKIRRQFLIEGIATGAFVVLYYDMFDGAQKPLLANVFLVSAWLLIVIHNFYAYLYFKSTEKGENMEQLLSDRLHKMKLYARTTGLLRILAGASFLYFFISVIRFTAVKYWILAGIILFFLIQMALFAGIWRNRVGRMKEIINSLRAG